MNDIRIEFPNKMEFVIYVRRKKKTLRSNNRTEKKKMMRFIELGLLMTVMIVRSSAKSRGEVRFFY